MSNYVNNVNVQNTTYALGPLMSTASGGIVDNKSGVYSAGNNCIIHANVYDYSASVINSNLVLNTNVSVGDDTTLYNTTIIGGGGMSLSGGDWFNSAAFINCDTSSNGTVYGGGAHGNTFIGLYGYSVNDGFDTNMLLGGTNNVVQGYASYTNAAGFHAVATRTVYLYASYPTNTSIEFPPSCCGVYTITVINPDVCDKFNFVVKNQNIQSDFNMYASNSYYYCSSTGNVGISISNGNLYLYTTRGDGGTTQVTLSYDVVPYAGGSSSSDDDSYSY